MFLRDENLHQHMYCNIWKQLGRIILVGEIYQLLHHHWERSKMVYHLFLGVENDKKLFVSYLVIL